MWDLRRKCEGFAAQMCGICGAHSTSFAAKSSLNPKTSLTDPSYTDRLARRGYHACKLFLRPRLQGAAATQASDRCAASARPRTPCRLSSSHKAPAPGPTVLPFRIPERGLPIDCSDAAPSPPRCSCARGPRRAQPVQAHGVLLGAWWSARALSFLSRQHAFATERGIRD